MLDYQAIRSPKPWDLFLSLVTAANMSCYSVSFLDDNKLAVDGDNAAKEMLTMLNQHDM